MTEGAGAFEDLLLAGVQRMAADLAQQKLSSMRAIACLVAAAGGEVRVTGLQEIEAPMYELSVLRCVDRDEVVYRVRKRP